MSDMSELTVRYWLNHGYSKPNARYKAMQENYIKANMHTVSNKKELAELKSAAKRKFPLESDDSKKNARRTGNPYVIDILPKSPR